MSKPSLVYFAADSDRNLRIEITKDLDVALMVLRQELGKPIDLVRVEEYGTMIEATGRLDELIRMPLEERAKLVEESNPSWATLARMSPSGPPPELLLGEWLGIPPPRDPPPTGGVAARTSNPKGPRAAGDAKQRPREAD